MNATIVGVTGYTGTILLKLLVAHPGITGIIPVSHSRVGMNVEDVFSFRNNALSEKTVLTKSKIVSLQDALGYNSDIIFSTLPHCISAKGIGPFLSDNIIIDLSADMRFDSVALYEKIYKTKHPYPEQAQSALYGLTEWNNSHIKGNDIIANPGCYATATLLPLLPLVKENIITGDIIINALSGISGAGKKPDTNLMFCERSENAGVYAPGKSHRHTAEITHQLEKEGFSGDVIFNPHLVPMSRGIAVTTTANCNDYSEQDIHDVFRSSYKESPFITFSPDLLPQTAQVRNTNRCIISWKKEGDKILLFSVIDNLLKGASGQAVQNMNIRLGFEETDGLPLLNI